MKFRHVAKINSSDGGDPLYFIDGEKQDDIYSDDQLLRTLLGKSFQVIWLKSEDSMDEEEQEAFWSTSSFDDLDDLLEHLRAHPTIVEDV